MLVKVWARSESFSRTDEKDERLLLSRGEDVVWDVWDKSSPPSGAAAQGEDMALIAVAVAFAVARGRSGSGSGPGSVVVPAVTGRGTMTCGSGLEQKAGGGRYSVDGAANSCPGLPWDRNAVLAPSKIGTGRMRCCSWEMKVSLGSGWTLPSLSCLELVAEAQVARKGSFY